MAKKQSQIITRIDLATRQKLDSIAADRNTKISTVIREALSSYLKASA
jgi:predicted transcriptional regulator